MVLLLPTGWRYQPIVWIVIETQFNVKDEDHAKGGADYLTPPLNTAA